MVGLVKQSTVTWGFPYLSFPLILLSPLIPPSITSVRSTSLDPSSLIQLQHLDERFKFHKGSGAEPLRKLTSGGNNYFLA